MRSFLGHESQDCRDTRTKAAVIPEASCNAAWALQEGTGRRLGRIRSWC